MFSPTILLLAAASCAAPQESPRTQTNSLGMTLVLVPAGEFVMGADKPASETREAFPWCSPELLPRESPAHRVRITKPFYMGQCEVTLGQFRAFLKDAHFKVDAENGQPMTGYGPKGDIIESTEFRPWAPGWKIGDDHPAQYVSWNDAVAFCAWLSRKEGKEYRLPTEAEWEYACRAGTRTRYCCGSDPEELVNWANTPDADRAALYPNGKTSLYGDDGQKTGTTIPYPFLKGHDGFAWTAPVGSFQPNAFGLCDMHGNSWEWCSDWLGEDYYSHSPVDDPKGPPSGEIRVSRGGGFDNGPETTRAARRDGGTPESHDCHDGFRVVCER
jgi:formylglycine-generating enzyme required for sulfatase activity